MTTAADVSAADVPTPPRIARGTGLDRAFEILCFSAATFLLTALGGIVISLAIGGWPAFEAFGFGFFTSSNWDPVQEIYGAAGAVTGTLVTATLALLFALPLAFGIAIFLVELCPPILRRTIGTAVELLAGIPSIVYGMWGLFVFAPWFAKHVQMPIMMSVEPGSFWEKITAGVPNGAGILSASIILAIMILPFIAATTRELLLTIPPQVRESAYGLGSTTFEVITKVSLPYIRTGAIGAVMLGLGRALGETMAVTFIIGNSHGFPTSIFASGSTIASTIANEFAEATDRLHSASLIALGLVLFVITFAVLALARLLIGRQVHA
ncbi:phosphate ABC transporter permease subunit PstC [Phenylobacterium sp.]|uniref:phosphate ABC transporter permease subunit PstC n=1 Tax=Phenylobacterium sp. TaxID=1871053 RepID=UPI00121532FB|nr:phosphate ABC transporter permease subunit PstC [Phenylobacterium sp.]TAL29366.1 MAG: phosphate ABC transporter permease subunit PstC [Phenylobacterium sp.]